MSTLALALVFTSVSQTFNLPPGLLSSLCYVESHHVSKAVNKNDGGSDSIGACQIKYNTARMLGYTGTPAQLLTPKTNIYWAGAYLRKQADRYHNDWLMAVSAYNTGTYKRNQDGLPVNIGYIRKVLIAWSDKR